MIALLLRLRYWWSDAREGRGYLGRHVRHLVAEVPPTYMPLGYASKYRREVWT